MKLSTKEIVESVAKELAHGSDEEQAAFFNAFFSEVHVGCRGERREEQQFCYLSDRLTPRSIESIKSLAEFVKLRENEAKASGVAG